MNTDPLLLLLKFVLSAAISVKEKGLSEKELSWEALTQVRLSDSS